MTKIAATPRRGVARRKGATKKKLGRPPIYTDQTRVTICDRMAKGESLATICDTPGMPSRQAVSKWLLSGDHPDFVVDYARAHDDRADFIHDQMLVIADNSRIGTITTEKGDGTVETKTADMVERARLQVDTRKWVLARMNSKKYGDKTETTVQGGDKPLQIKVETLSLDVLEARYRALREQSAGG